jgi:hypothetical protein
MPPMRTTPMTPMTPIAVILWVRRREREAASWVAKPVGIDAIDETPTRKNFR